MECLRARNFAAMAVFSCPSGRSRRRTLRTTKRGGLSEKRCRFYQVKASSAGSYSCVAIKEEFADEEDYVKAGGSELVFVQMQQDKAMKKQSNIAHKLPPIPIGDDVLDLVVIGCGPAGLALAAESAKLGCDISVGLIGPNLPFTNNYGVWEDEFKDLGLEGCIEHVWRDTIAYLDDDDPVLIGRAYGRVSGHLFHQELLRRCVESGVLYLRIIEAADGHSLVACEPDMLFPKASGKLLQYEVGGPQVSVQTAYDVEVEKVPSSESEYSTFLYVMPMSSTRVFLEETCLASKGAMPFDLLRRKLMSRLETMGIRILKTFEEMCGNCENESQIRRAIGHAAGSMTKPTLKDQNGNFTKSQLFDLNSAMNSNSKHKNFENVEISTLKLGKNEMKFIFGFMLTWNTLWPQERKRQRGFLGSTMSLADLILFALYMFVIAPNDMRMCLVRHLLSHPTGATMIRTYLTV
ncbi:hypothetical protein P3X46_007603 [Hevea brasiliensis]|uniref:Lycopene epsilon cyclase n=1 Tax=Hevea brasiliensis TaxID=3981 RepID=A0ABQ9MWI3_HEVBR|nr:hypothetical protein P3X46_007603 [Hevea brasiliensis]